MSLKITEELRSELKKPIGKLCKNIRKKGFLITVGDVCSLEAVENNIIPNLIVYDGKIRRRQDTKAEKKLDNVKVKKIEVKNPAGLITDETWIAVEEGLKENSKIKVNGEEDLLVIPCVKLAKKNSIVYYGQPDVGMVEIIVDDKIKTKMEKIIKKMEVVE